MLIDGRTGEVVVPNGSLGFRYTDSGVGKWNLDLGDIVPQLTVLGDGCRRRSTREAGPVRHPGRARRGADPRGAGPPGRRHAVLHGVRPDAGAVRGAPRRAARIWPTGWDDPSEPYTPAWQESITGVSASQVVRVAQEFAHNAEESGGRSMIIMGAGICQWFHGDATYRAILAMLILTGSMGRNGGGWAHYVGQEKCRPITGWATMAGPPTGSGRRGR